MKEKKRKWKEVLDDAFEGLLDKPIDDEVAWMALGMIMFEAVRNSYPEVKPEDVAFETARHVSFNQNVSSLMNEGRVERVRREDGKYIYRRTAIERADDRK